VLVLCASLVGSVSCSGGCGGAPVANDSTDTTRGESSGSTTSPGTASEAVASSSGSSAPRDASPPPRLEIVLQDDVLHVRNVGDAVARLKGRVRLEQRGSNGWEDVALELGLRASCEQAIPECVSLVPGAELLPPRWLGTRGDAQCACERCTAVTGELRFVVESCAPEGHTPHRIEGEPFRR
jgi:hypothetical protein